MATSYRAVVMASRAAGRPHGRRPSLDEAAAAPSNPSSWSPSRSAVPLQSRQSLRMETGDVWTLRLGERLLGDHRLGRLRFSVGKRGLGRPPQRTRRWLPCLLRNCNCSTLMTILLGIRRTNRSTPQASGSTTRTGDRSLSSFCTSMGRWPGSGGVTSRSRSMGRWVHDCRSASVEACLTPCATNGVRLWPPWIAQAPCAGTGLALRLMTPASGGTSKPSRLAERGSPCGSSRVTRRPEPRSPPVPRCRTSYSGTCGRSAVVAKPWSAGTARPARPRTTPCSAQGLSRIAGWEARHDRCRVRRQGSAR